MTNGNGMIYDFAAYCEDPEGVMKITVYVGEEFVDEVKGRSSVYIKRLNNGSFTNSRLIC